ncbi:MAG: protein-export chaperone SecB [Proteobacteria bacterium]|nr:protein-export chaperone SecB [Pseudomonadota bacterium]
MTEENGQQAPQPGIQIVTQFIKDVSFENPHAPESLVSGWPAPETNVQISLGQKQVNETTFESTVKLRVEAKNTKDDKMAFIIDLEYGALVALQNVQKDHVPAVLMVEVPKLLFPFIREIVAQTTTKGGYPPLYLAPISFEEMYVAEMKRLQEQEAAGNS